MGKRDYNGYNTRTNANEQKIW